MLKADSVATCTGAMPAATRFVFAFEASFAAGERLVREAVHERQYCSFSRLRREKETERRKRTATKVRSAKTNRPDFFRGKQPVFPSGEKQSRRQTPTPFSAKRGTQPFAFHRGREPKRGLWFTPKSILESYAVQRDAARPSANPFFKK